MGGHIDCYLDCADRYQASFYGYLTIVYLNKQRERLAAHDVTVELHPIFLGGVNVGSGNKPPWSLPAKAAYGVFDGNRAKRYHGFKESEIEAPSFFPPLTLLPMRALCYIKATFPTKTFESIWLTLFQKLWTPPNQIDITKPDLLRSVFSESNLFSTKEIDDILSAAAQKEWKDKLLANTQEVLDQGAFGAPWFWVRNGEGKEEPFFGSDRFHFMWEFLGLPWQDVEILPPGTKAGRSKL